MSEKINPRAFPRAATWSPCGQHVVGPESGMTLRDWFAGQCLASAAALPLGDEDCAFRAARCYEMADAMLAARLSGERP